MLSKYTNEFIGVFLQEWQRILFNIPCAYLGWH